MSWSDPRWLVLAAAALAAAAAVPLLARWRALQQARLASRPLWRRWLGGVPATGAARVALWLLAAAAAGVAAAGPRWGRPAPLPGRGLDAVIALDVSASMRCADVTPDRLDRAVYVLRQALERTPNATWGLAVGAGTARRAVPLTSDADSVAAALANRDLGQGLTPGSNLALLLATAASMLDAGGPARAILLVSDGEQLEGDATAMAQGLRRTGVAIVTLTAGTEGGAPVPRRTPDGGIAYVRDSAGALVRSRAHPELMRSLDASPADAIDAGTADAARALSGALAGAVRATARETTPVRSAPPALAAALLATAAFLLWPWRRSAGVLLLVVPATLGAAPPPAAPPLWQRLLPGSAAVMARRGEAALERGAWGEASRAYGEALALRPGDRDVRLAWATAASLAGAPGGEVALEQLAGSPAFAAIAWYNLGTVRLLRGDAAAAVPPLRRAVQADPTRAEAWRNLELALTRRSAQTAAATATGRSDARSRAKLVEAAARAALTAAPRVAGAPPPAAGRDW
ncbi:MAG: VWA domain-containing protein [Thermoanaerobaculaceae bacterium]|nr:VWA domain-containing protein [Thermoanaerobaculaceae bacterium]